MPDTLLMQETDPGVFEIDPKNYAEDADVNRRALAFVQRLLEPTRTDRRSLETEWSQLYNIWDVRRDVYYYQGRAALYLAAGHRLVERAIAKEMAHLFPSGDDFFDVRPLPAGADAQEDVASRLESQNALMWYDLHESLRIRRTFPVFLRQLNILGTSVYATDYVRQEDVERPRRYHLGKTATGHLGPTAYVPKHQVGPRGRPVDLFTWYIWPPSANSIAEATAVFEDQLVTERVLTEWRAMERYAFLDAELHAHRGQAPRSSIWAAADRLRERGVTQDKDAPNSPYVVTTLYADWSPEEDRELKPFKFSIVNDALLIEARQNPWWHQEPPYDWARILTYVDEAYGRGLVYFIRQMQYQINDTLSQTFDALTYSLNPIAAVDPMLCPDPSLLVYRPGAKWPIPGNAVQWYKIPSSGYEGFQAVRQLYEFTQEISGVGTSGGFLPTLGMARGAETATGQSLLVAQGDVDMRLITDSIEEECLEPLLHRVDSMEQQFLPQHEDRILRALGPKAIPLLRDNMRARRDLMLGTRTYTWIGGHISEQREQTQKQMPALMALASKLQGSPDGKIDLFGLFEDFYRSLGFANASDRIKRRKTPQPYDPDLPRLEHLVMKAGRDVRPNMGEPHQRHLADHDAALPMAQAQGWGDRLIAHMVETLNVAREEAAFGGQALGMGLPPGNGQPAGPGRPGRGVGAPGGLPATPMRRPGIPPEMWR